MAAFRVKAPYVTLKVKGRIGKPQVNGFYAGAIVNDEDIDKDSLKRHVSRGMVERLSAAEVRAEVKEQPKPAKKAAPAKQAESAPKDEPQGEQKSED